SVSRGFRGTAHSTSNLSMAAAWSAWVLRLATFDQSRGGTTFGRSRVDAESRSRRQTVQSTCYVSHQPVSPVRTAHRKSSDAVQDRPDGLLMPAAPVTRRATLEHWRKSLWRMHLIDYRVPVFNY